VIRLKRFRSILLVVLTERLGMKATLLLLVAAGAASAQSRAEDLIAAGHWKRARALVEARFREAPMDALSLYLTSQIRFAFGDADTPLKLAEKALALDGGAAKYHRQVAEVIGVMAQHANVFQLLSLARRFKKEIDAAIALDPNDIQALRDLMEFYLLAPGMAGGDKAEARAVAERIGGIDRAQGLSAQSHLAAFDKDAGRAGELLRMAADSAPGSYKANLELAQFELAEEHRNLGDAELAARAALRIDPTRVAAYSALAEVYALGGRREDLESLLAEADLAVPDDLAPHYRAAEAMLRTGKHLDAARQNLRKYLTQEPEGNEPTAAEAREKLESAQGNPRL
jgi:tetratricopeptide (TPR) repeat protein